MNEMLYGNTGRSDEGINISMNENLFKYLKDRVGKLKGLLPAGLQNGTNSFVYIGEMGDKSSSYTVFGYNSKLRNDSRQGDYGHYVSLPLNDNKPCVDFGEIGFLSEEGFIEFANQNNISDEKRFHFTAPEIYIDENAKKRLVNNILEVFTRTKKRKSASFSIDGGSFEESSLNAVAAFEAVIKYLPYAVRRKISFISQVNTNQRTDTINLSAYPQSSEFKPRDCVDLSGFAPAFSEGMFAEFTEKLFSMNDEQREEYFESLYRQIEVPIMEAGLDVKSDVYLMDIGIKRLWTQGDAKAAVESIFSSLDDILKIYPYYRQIANDRLSQNSEETNEYIKSEIKSAESIEALKAVYENMTQVSKLCSDGIGKAAAHYAAERAADFIANCRDDKSFFETMNSLNEISPEIIDVKAAAETVSGLFARKESLDDIYGFYEALTDKGCIESGVLREELEKRVDSHIVSLTEKSKDSKEKFLKLQKIYTDFERSHTNKDISVVREVCEKRLMELKSGMRNEAFEKARAVISEIKLGLDDKCSIFDCGDFIKKLAEIDVSCDNNIKADAAGYYSRISKRIFEALVNSEVEYIYVSRFLAEIKPSAELLESKEIYDKKLRSGFGGEKYVADGLNRLLIILNTFTANVNSADSLADAICAYDDARAQIKREEADISAVFEVVGAEALNYWLKKNPKQASLSALKKAEKDAAKRRGEEISKSARSVVESFCDKGESQSKKAVAGIGAPLETDKVIGANYANNVSNGGKKASSPMNTVLKTLIIVLIAAVISIIAFCATRYFGNLAKDRSAPTEPTIPEASTEAEQTIAPYTLETALNSVEAYFEGFSSEENPDKAFLVLGTAVKSAASENSFDVVIAKSFDTAYAADGVNITVVCIPEQEAELSAVITGDATYAMVLQRNQDKFLLRHVFVYDAAAVDSDASYFYRILDEQQTKPSPNTDDELLLYIGHELGKITDGQAAPDTGIGVEAQTESASGSQTQQPSEKTDAQKQTGKGVIV